MRRWTMAGAGAFLCAVAVLSAGLLAQDQAPEMSAEEQAMMEAWTKYMTPGEPHARLTSREGRWEIDVKMWHGPDMPYPEESTAKSTIKSIMDGRYILEKVEGEAMGEPFHGMGIGGYDNIKNKYVGIWIDTMMTGILNYVGTEKRDGTIEFSGYHPDPLHGTYEKSRSVEKKISHDQYVYTAYHMAPDGSEYKSMELTYRRVK